MPDPCAAQRVELRPCSFRLRRGLTALLLFSFLIRVVKKWISIGAVVLSMAGLSKGQSAGRVMFGNNPATAISNTDGRAFVGQVSLYGSSALGLPDDAALRPVGGVVNTFSPGLFSGGPRYIGEPGDRVTLQVRAWTGNFPNYESAFVAALTGDTTVWLGKSPKWE